MIYEIKSRSFSNPGSSNSIGYLYYNKENAEKDCKRLNELMDVYFVAEVKMQDSIKD